LPLLDYSGNYTLEYAALFAYSPHGLSEEEKLSRSYRTAVKGDESISISGQEFSMSALIARTIEETRDGLPFWRLFEEKPVLVPARSTSLMKPDSLWVPLRIATELHKAGSGSQVSTCLERVKPLQKAATSTSGNRPSAAQHQDSQRVQKLISDPNSILIVDDVVTSGATLVGSSKCLKAAFPNARISAFAAMRTVSNSNNFKEIIDPIINNIVLYPSGRTHRFPD